MQTKQICVLVHSWTKGEVGAPWNRLKPSSKIFLLTIPRTEQSRTDYLFDVNYTVSSQSNTIIIIYISRSQILLKCLKQVVVLI